MCIVLSKYIQSIYSKYSYVIEQTHIYIYLTYYLRTLLAHFSVDNFKTISDQRISQPRSRRNSMIILSVHFMKTTLGHANLKMVFLFIFFLYTSIVLYCCNREHNISVYDKGMHEYILHSPFVCRNKTTALFYCIERHFIKNK